MEKLTMNRKEREQAKTFELLRLKSITTAEAAARLKITPKWIRKKYKRYLANGDAGLVHKSRGKPSHLRLDQEKIDLIIKLAKTDYEGFRPKFIARKLAQQYGIKICKETTRKILINSNIWNEKKQRIKHRKWRERKPMLGMMVQLDGSPHAWFENRGEKCTLLVFIDDATSQILWLEFTPTESLQALMQATKNYVKRHGIPQVFYNDHGIVFSVNLNNPERDKKTSWEKSVASLGIQVIHAHSPQAKGRVERHNRTLQEHLVNEFRLAQISSIDAANQFIHSINFIESYNNEFSVEAAQPGNAHKCAESYDLDDVFSIREERILNQDFTIAYHTQIYQLEKTQGVMMKPKMKVIVRIGFNDQIDLFIKNIPVKFQRIFQRPKAQNVEKIQNVDEISQRGISKPRRSSILWNNSNPKFLESRMKSACRP